MSKIGALFQPTAGHLHQSHRRVGPLPVGIPRCSLRVVLGEGIRRISVLTFLIAARLGQHLIDRPVKRGV